MRKQGSITFEQVQRVLRMITIFVAFGGVLLTTACGYVSSTASTSGSTGAPTSQLPTSTPQPPTSVKLSVTIVGNVPSTQSNLTIPSGKQVRLVVLPNHSLLPFQTFTMGIYATDPYGFSELQYCTYPHTDTCSYTISYSSSENTDYTKGQHTFKAFLGDIGGAITVNSSPVTIKWS